MPSELCMGALDLARVDTGLKVGSSVNGWRRESCAWLQRQSNPNMVFGLMNMV